MVVDSPWPERAVVSGGKFLSFFNDSFRCTAFPPGRSVRPHEPLKSVSPTSAMWSAEKYNVQEPGV